MQVKLLFKHLLLPRRYILLQWIKPRHPTVNQWHGKIFLVILMERLSPILKDVPLTDCGNPFLDDISLNISDILQEGVMP